MKKGKTRKRGRYFGDMRFKGVSLLPIFFVLVLLLNLIMPVVALAATEKKDEKKDSGTSSFTAASNLRTNEELYKKANPYLKYSETLHKEMVLRILRDQPLKSTQYSELYRGDSGALKEKDIGNTSIMNKIATDAVGDKEADGKDKSDPRGIVWTPFYILDEEGKVFKSSRDLYEYDNGFFGKDYSKEAEVRPVFMADMRKYDLTKNDKTKRMGLSYEMNAIIKYGTGLFIGSKDNMIKSVTLDLAAKGNQQLPFIKHTLYYPYKEGISMTHEYKPMSRGTGYSTGYRSKDNIEKGTQWTYATSRATLYNYGKKTSVGSDQTGMALVGIDSYGNILNKNLDVIVPFWQNNTFSDFTFLKDGKKFLTSPLLKDYSKSSSMLKEALKSKDNKFYELTDDKTKGEFEGIFEGGYKSGKKNKLSGGYDEKIKGLYNSPSDAGNKEAYDKFINKVADLIVSKTSGDVKKWNEKFLANLEKDKDMEAYMDSSNAKYDTYSSENLTNVTEALDGIYSAKTLMERIGRILDVGFFELIRLTVASMITDFYNSTIINYSVGDIFYTKLLSESDLWKKAINTLLIVVVSFMSIYLILLIVRMFMGHITAKGILLRFVILTIATVSPMIVYSPLVNLAFNKPVDLTLGKELDRMFMLDVWLKKWEKAVEESDVNLSFLPSGNLRERKEEYTVPVYTSTHVDGYDLNTSTGMSQVGNNPTEGKVVVVNVSAFHIIDWLEKGKGLSLFDFLANNYTEDYEGIGTYKEFAYDTSVSIGGIKDYKGDRLKASTLLRRVYNDLVNEEYVKEPAKLNFNTTLYETTNELFGNEKFSQSVTDQVLFDLTTTSYARQKVYRGKKDENPFSSPTLKLADDKVLDLPKDDLFGLRDTVKGLSAYRLNSTSELSSEVTEINRKVADDYIYNYMKLRSLVNSSEYNKAEKSVLLMKIWFEINDKMELPLFPTKYSQSSVTLDTYVRALFIPLNEFKPTATDVDNVAKYITVRSDLGASILFGIAILALFLYGMIKFFVLFVILMPLILVSFFYNYVWLENTKSKAWVGALGIMGSFALINLGLMLLWKGLIYALNLSVYESSQVGSNMYPATLLHSLALLVYLVLAFQFILRPLARTVKSDIGNLGGTRMADRAVTMGGSVKASMKSFWNNMKDPGSVVGKTRVGNGMMSAFSAAKNSLRGKQGKDTGLAGALDPAKMAERRTSDEKKRDAAEVANVDQKLANASKAAGKSGAADAVSGVVGAGAGVAGAVAEREARIAANRAGAGVAGANSMLNVLGLSKFRNMNTGDKTDARGMFEKLKDAKNAAGKAWVDSKDAFDSEKSKNALARVSALIKTSEEIDAIPDIEDGSNPLTGEDMTALEEVGMDKAVVGTDSRIGIEPVSLAAGVMSGMVARVMRSNGLNVASAGGQVLMDLTADELADASKRKQVLAPVLGEIGKMIDEISNSSMNVTNRGAGMAPEKITDTRFRLEDNEMRPHVLNYVEKLRKEGMNVKVSESADGGVELTFANADEAKASVEKITDGSFAIAKALGIEAISSYDVTADRVGAMTRELDQAGVGYSTTTLADGTTNFALTGGSADVAKVDEILATHSQIASSVREISGGLSTVDSNVIVADAVESLTKAGELTAGTDYLVGTGGAITLVSDTAKRAVMEIESTYGTRVADTMTDLENFAVSIGDTIVGNEGGIEMSGYVAGTSVEVDEAIVGAGIGRENYTMNNRSFDVADFESTVEALQVKRHGFESKIVTLDNAVSGLAESIQMEETAYRTDFANRLQSLTDDEMLSNPPVALSNVINSMNGLEELHSTGNLDGVDYESQKAALRATYDSLLPESRETYVASELEDRYSTISTMMADKGRLEDDLERAKTDAKTGLTNSDRTLIDAVTKAKAMDVKWNRTGENSLEFSSSIPNQQKLVETMVSSFDEVSRSRKPKPVAGNPEGNANERPRTGRQR